MQVYSALKRDELTAQLLSNEYDLLIIGGGITGAGIALDAASRGIRTALIEKNDFASGTSSRSTKLIHGGLRYLKQFEVGLVMEVGRERRIVHNLAPHLVVSEKMLLPFFKNGTFGKFSAAIGLWVYDFLAGVRNEDRKKMLSRSKTLELEPLLPGGTLKGSGLYAEYRTDDARLTIEVIKTAIARGADCINYLEAKEFIYDDNRITGVRCTDRISGKELEIFAKFIVSATGPWVDDLRDKDHSKKGKTLHLTKGVHIVLPGEKFPIRHSIYFDVTDGRMIFAIPRGKITYVGTTDTDYFESKEKINTSLQDAEYLVDAVNNAFPSLSLTIDDVVSSWAGLRPLINQAGKNADEISRKDEVFISDSGLISIAGGKLTGYRKMSIKVVNIVAGKLKSGYNISSGKCLTRSIKLHGNDFHESKDVGIYIERIANNLEARKLGLVQAKYLVHNYGTATDEILKAMLESTGNDPELELLLAELKYSLENELVTTLNDFLIRRTGRLFFDIGSVKKYSEPVLAAMAKYFGWPQARVIEERKKIEAEIYTATHFE